jgi:hypothetical protein
MERLGAGIPNVNSKAALPFFYSSAALLFRSEMPAPNLPTCTALPWPEDESCPLKLLAGARHVRSRPAQMSTATMTQTHD